jgi:hypothetical protein
MGEPTPPFERIASFYKRLAASAQQLNVASDELGQPIADLEAALKKLNLGIPGWVEVESWENPQTSEYDKVELGYDKVSGRWGIAIRKSWGSANADFHDFETWLFGDAPRVHRIGAVDHIPALIEHLIAEADQTTERIKAKTAHARELAAAINEQVPQARTRKSGAGR